MRCVPITLTSELDVSVIVCYLGNCAINSYLGHGHREYALRNKTNIRKCSNASSTQTLTSDGIVLEPSLRHLLLL